jgi:hypothetical protein
MTRKPLLAIATALCLAVFARSEAAPPPSDLQFDSSNQALVSAFQWAKSQALAYAHEGHDPVGPWYEAALPGRNAFCMRDVAHQANAAAALGLDEANHNMLARFAAAVSPARNWAGYWEIDLTGRPALADYSDDRDFWYNLPANFDLLDAAVRLWRWTGDDRYLAEPAFARFYQATAKEYVSAWALEPDRILERSRMMNRREKPKRDDSRGIPSYTEGRSDFNVGVDLLAAEYRAYQDLAVLAERDADAPSQAAYLRTAAELSQLIERYAWAPSQRHYFGLLSDRKGFESGDLWILRFGATSDPERIRGALNHLLSSEFLSHIGVEEESYLPSIFFRYGETDAAVARLLALSDPGKKRREYPEVSFAVIDAIVSGLMGIEVDTSASTEAPIRTRSRLPKDTDDARIDGLPVRVTVIEVRHRGHGQSTMRNDGNNSVRWQPEFPGQFPLLYVDHKPTPASTNLGYAKTPVSTVIVNLAPHAEVTVSVTP